MAVDISKADEDNQVPAKAPERKSAPPERETTFLGYMREWADALVIAFIVAMFIRTFVVELFKIPTGSMSPTLLGDFVAEGRATDRSGDEHQYLLISDHTGQRVQVFQMQEDGHYDYLGKESRINLTRSQQTMLASNIHREEHRILVNKFAYWFKEPERGDIVIFRVPFKTDPVPYERNGVTIPGPQYERDQAVYVKRAVALGGESLRIGDDGHLYVNGEMVTEPEILTKFQYIVPDVSLEYDVDVPEDHVIALGDNSDNSLDSRFWGPLPETHLRGKAVIRYWPRKDKWFLNPK